MFTGIVTSIGEVRKAEQRGDLRLQIGCDFDLASVDMGASIACSGTCLTVVDKGDDWFAVELSAESVARTASDLWEVGARLNLERARRLGDELGGHLVTGHVDAVGQVVEVQKNGASLHVAVEVPAALGSMLASKGSVTLDGVSLTVNTIEDKADSTRFTVNIIPHTGKHRTLGGLRAGSTVNIEMDVLARYLQRMVGRTAA